ncbi:hypothetical protein C923_04394 [Plasmodium falciparum UGT5.1]|uniref:Uncharacterized protein n=1 Tax=Plasmodium falciparum UGT5.1 TaxID=1237627 RepID=W7JTQ5_PLAFA|nr:hypothetical protein C923_04394 [Plasmodium falciparum UGT5.1]
MFTLISVCSYLFYTHKESLLNLIGLSENRNSRKNRRRKKKTLNISKYYFSKILKKNEELLFIVL